MTIPLSSMSCKLGNDSKQMVSFAGTGATAVFAFALAPPEEEPPRTITMGNRREQHR